MEEKIQIPENQPVTQQIPMGVDKKKVNPLIIVVLLVVILLIGVGGMYASKFLNKPKACTLEAQICPDGSSVGRTGPNCEFAPCSTQVPSSSQTPDISNWKTYKDKGDVFEVNYPSDFLVNADQGLTEIFSPPCNCDAESGVGWAGTISASQVRLSFQLRQGENFNAIWKSAFGFDFSDKNYDGISTVGGKKAYYFVQGAEATFGRRAYLIEISSTSALEIDTYEPLLVHRCESCFGKNNPTNIKPDQILSTFKFTGQTNQNQTKFTCPQNGWVDCMPIMDEAKELACSSEAEAWYKINCPNFQGFAQ